MDIYFIENLLLLSCTFDVLLWFGVLTGWGFPEWQTWLEEYYPYRAMWSGGSQKINILHNIKIYLEMCSCDWKLLRLCFGFFNVTVFLSVVMLETSRPPSLCNCLTLRQGPKLPLEGINPIFCTLLMLLTLVFQFTTFYSRWMPSTLFSFQTILVTQKVSVARLRP